MADHRSVHVHALADAVDRSSAEGVASYSYGTEKTGASRRVSNPYSTNPASTK